MGQILSRIGSSRGSGAATASGALGGTVTHLVALAIPLSLMLAAEPVQGLWGWPAAGGLVLYALIAALVLFGVRNQALGRFGAANGVTLLRAAIVAFLAAVALRPEPFSDALRGSLVVLGAILLLLDGLDGWLARRGGLASRFGARFDMEIDALSILVFTFLLLRADQAGSWVLVIGLARYIFVGVGWLWPPLARELAPNLRRKTICVVVATALLFALAPVIDPAPSRMICAVTLVLLVYSFAMDCVWLLTLWRTEPR